MILFTAFACGVSINAQTTQLRGVVRDSVTHEPIPYVALFLEGTDNGVLSEENGTFKLSSPQKATELRVSVMGYATKTVELKSSQIRNLIIDLSPDGVQLNEIIVKPTKEKYSKKNNPAVEFLERIRATRDINDPYRNDYFNYDKYERMTIALNDFNPSDDSWIGRKFDFLKDHIDISEVSGKPILNVAVQEKSSSVHYRKSPESEREYVKGIKREGVDQMADQESMRRFMEDVFREIDIYDGNDVTLLQNRFVSPLSRIATDFYKYYLSDTIVVESDSCIVLSFVPHTPQTFGFLGKLYVPKNDSTMFIKKIDLYLPHSINVNFVDAMSVSQTYEKAPDGSRLKTKDDMIVEFRVMPGTPSFYTRRNTVYNNFSFDRPPVGVDDVFSHAEHEVVDASAFKRDDDFWEKNRLVPLEVGEGSVKSLVERLRSVPLYYWTEKTLKLLVSGYAPTGKNSKFDYGPVNTSISYNTAEGVRLRTGGMTTANLSKRWFGRGYVAYGLRDHKWKYKAELEYSFIDKEYHSREFPVKSLRFTQSYELDQLGQKYLFTNQDNLFLSFKRMEDTRVTYRRLTALDYTLELRNGFSLVAGFAYERQEATKWIPFIDGAGKHYGHYNEAAFNIKLRYAPGEKFYQGRTNRYPINLDAPVIELTHTYAPRGFMGSMFPINRTELRLQKHIWLSAFGYIDAVAKGGHVWEAAPYLNLLLPNANLSYTIQPESFALMNPLEFINDTYGLIDITYWANGALFTRLPLLKKSKLREVVSFKSLWGHLSKKNDPTYNPELFRFPEDITVTRMSGRPYMEISAGLDNIFSVLRVDYVWRLSYRNTPGAPNSGLRIAMHFTF